MHSAHTIILLEYDLSVLSLLFQNQNETKMILNFFIDFPLAHVSPLWHLCSVEVVKTNFSDCQDHLHTNNPLKRNQKRRKKQSLENLNKMREKLYSKIDWKNNYKSSTLKVNEIPKP
jgi:hypothetical protein